MSRIKLYKIAIYGILFIITFLAVQNLFVTEYTTKQKDEHVEETLIIMEETDSLKYECKKIFIDSKTKLDSIVDE